jgi:uncharacterized protein (DUF1501 family)
VLRGAAPKVGWAPVTLPPAAGDTAARLLDLYQHRDPALASALSQGLRLEKTALGDDMKARPGGNNVGAMRLVARGAAKVMAADDGPRIAALAFDGWDTHANEGGPVGRLANSKAGSANAGHTVIVIATDTLQPSAIAVAAAREYGNDNGIPLLTEDATRIIRKIGVA